VSLVVLVLAGACGSSEPANDATSASARAPDIALGSAVIRGDAPGSRDDAVTGNWRMQMGRTTWIVRLEPRPNLMNEYEGIGTRTTPGDDGKEVTMGVGAIVDGREFRTWLGAGLVVCKGPFEAIGVIQGTCTGIDGTDVGALRGERQ
jgi:hypothetical protein